MKIELNDIYQGVEAVQPSTVVVEDKVLDGLLWDLWAHTFSVGKSLSILLESGYVMTYLAFVAEMKARDMQFAKDMGEL